MSDQNRVMDHAARHRAVRQMHAWFRRALPDEYRELDAQLLNADLCGDELAYDRIEDTALAVWRDHRDDPLPPGQQRSAELGQAVAWLGDRHELTWLRAHGLTLNHEEQDRDLDRLIGFWHEHRDIPVLPDEVTGYVEALSQVRQDRLDQAKAWHREHDPAGHAAWQMRRGFADSLGDECTDDRTLLREWATHHPDHADHVMSPQGSRAPRRVSERSDRAQPVREAAGFSTVEMEEDHDPARGL